MKKLMFLFILTVAMTLTAHAPSDMTLTYEPETNLLTVEIDHGVRDTDRHYIDNVKLTNEGKEVIIHNISRQENEKGITLIYRIPDIAAGSVLSVTATCNRIGRMTRSIEIQ